MGIDLDMVMAILAIIGYAITFYTFYRNQKKEHEETIRKLQKIEDTQAEHGRRLNDHNRYAEMFREYGEDIAFIRGKLE